MIGYGLVNSAVHEICLNQIIVSFLSRSSIFLANFYLQSYIRQLSGLLSTKQQDDLVNLFLEEEKYIAIQKNIENPDPNFNQEEIVYKYLLTANIISNKDYNYDLKTTEQVINDGKIALNNIFFEIYQKFLSNLNQNVGNILKLPDFEKTNDESKNFLLNLIKYSTFTFMNASVAEQNDNKDVLFDNPLVINPNNEIWPYKNSYTKSSYSSLAQIEPNKEYDLSKFRYDYFTSAGKFYNYGKIKPLLFGEFYYSIKPEKLEEFYKDIFNKPIFKNFFKDFQTIFKFTPYSGTEEKANTYQKKFLYFKELGYVTADQTPNKFAIYSFSNQQTSQIDKWKAADLSISPVGDNQFFEDIFDIENESLFFTTETAIVKKVILTYLDNSTKEVDFDELDINPALSGYFLETRKFKDVENQKYTFSNDYKGNKSVYFLPNNMNVKTITFEMGSVFQNNNAINSQDFDELKTTINYTQKDFLKNSITSFYITTGTKQNYKKVSDRSKVIIQNYIKKSYIPSELIINKDGKQYIIGFTLFYGYPEPGFDSDKIEKVVDPYYTHYTLTQKEILKFYKFSFMELKLIISEIRKLEKGIEEYFDLNFKLNLTQNADVTSNNLEFSNHHIYELFNSSFNKKDSIDSLNKYPPFYENLVFNNPTSTEIKDDTVPENKTYQKNLLGKDFFINFDNKVKKTYQQLYSDGSQKTIYIFEKPVIDYHNSVSNAYDILFKGPGEKNSKLPEDNPLFKLLFKKEGVVISVDDYNPTFPKFKVNYFITIADFIVNTENQDIYFSAIDDPKEAQFLIKKTYYQTVLNQLLEIKDSSDDNNIKYILDSYKFDELKKLSEQYDNFKPTSNYKVNMDKIYDFYNSKAEGKSYNLLTIRDTSLKILDAQIKVLENG